jgi:hypothetical protein
VLAGFEIDGDDIIILDRRAIAFVMTILVDGSFVDRRSDHAIGSQSIDSDFIRIIIGIAACIHHFIEEEVGIIYRSEGSCLTPGRCEPHIIDGLYPPIIFVLGLREIDRRDRSPGGFYKSGIEDIQEVLIFSDLVIISEDAGSRIYSSGEFKIHEEEFFIVERIGGDRRRWRYTIDVQWVL